MDEIERPKRSPKKKVDPDFEYDTPSASSKGLLEHTKSSSQKNRLTKKDLSKSKNRISLRPKKESSENGDSDSASGKVPKGRKETIPKQKSASDIKSTQNEEKSKGPKLNPLKVLQNGISGLQEKLQQTPMRKFLKASPTKANKPADQYSDMVSNPEKIFHDKSSQLDGKGGYVKVICNSKFYTKRLTQWKDECFKFYTEKFKKKVLAEKPTFETPLGGHQLKLVHTDFKTTISFWTKKSIVVVQGQLWEPFMIVDFIELKKRIDKNPPTAQDTAKTSTTSPARKRSRLSLKATRESGSSPAVQKLTTLFDQAESKPKDKSSKNKDDIRSPSKKFDSSKGHPPSVAALHNLGNTCYLNSVLQVLRFTPGFTEAIQKLGEDISVCEVEKEAICQALGEEYDEEEVLTWKIVKHLQELYKKMKKAEEKHRYGNSQYIAVRPYDVIYTIEKINPMFEGNLQHDAHELLRCVLAYVQDATKEVNKHRKEENMLQAKAEEEEPIAESEIVEIKDERDDKILSPKKTPPKKTLNTKLVKNNKTNQDTKNLSASKNVGSKTEGNKGKPLLNGVADDHESCDSDEVVLFDTFLNGYSSDKENLISRGKGYNLSHCNSAVADKESIEKDHTYSSPKKEDVKKDCNGTSQLVTTDSRKRKLSTGSDSGISPANPSQSVSKSQSSTSSVEQVAKNVKRQKGGRRSTKNSKAKKGKDLESDTNGGGDTGKNDEDSSQPRIFTMFDKSKNVKRLGMRGTVVSNHNEADTGEGHDPSGRVNGDVEAGSESIGGVQVSAQAKRALEKQQKLEMKTKQTARKTLGVKAPGAKVAGASGKGNESVDRTNQDEGSNAAKPGQSPKGEMAKIEAELEKFEVRTPIQSPNTEMKCEAKKHGESAVVKLTPGDMKHYYPIVNKAKQPTAFKKRNTEIIDDCVEHLFQGFMSSRIQCNECECFTERKEEYQDSCVPVRKEKTDDDDNEDGAVVVQEEQKPEGPADWIFDAFEEVERLVDDNKYFCNQCLRLVEAERSMHYVTLPQIFTLHLKRFATTSGYYGGVTKINDFVTTPMELPCIKDKCKETCSESNHRYELYALIIHTGISLSSGHYVAYVKAPKNNKQLPKAEMPSGSGQSGHSGTANQRLQKQEVVNEQEMPRPSTSMMLADPNNNADDNNNLDATMPNANLVALETSKVNTRSATNELTKEADEIDEDDIWYECDDDTIRELQQAELEYLLSASGGVTPYLLFYKQKL